MAGIPQHAVKQHSALQISESHNSRVIGHERRDPGPLLRHSISLILDHLAV